MVLWAALLWRDKMTTVALRISNVLYWGFFSVSLPFSAALIHGSLTSYLEANHSDAFGMVFVFAIFALLNVCWVVPQYLITGGVRVLAPKISSALLSLSILAGLGTAALEIKKEDAYYAANITNPNSIIASSYRNCTAFKKTVEAGKTFYPNKNFINACKGAGYIDKDFFTFDNYDPFTNTPLTATPENCADLGKRVPPGNYFAKYDKLSIDCVAKGLLPKSFISGADVDPFADIPVTVKPEDRKRVDILETCKRLDSHNLTTEEYLLADDLTKLCGTLKKKGLY